jgi:hypothetical protein
LSQLMSTWYCRAYPWVSWWARGTVEPILESADEHVVSRWPVWHAATHALHLPGVCQKSSLQPTGNRFYPTSHKCLYCDFLSLILSMLQNLFNFFYRSSQSASRIHSKNHDFLNTHTVLLSENYHWKITGSIFTYMVQFASKWKNKKGLFRF